MWSFELGPVWCFMDITVMISIPALTQRDLSDTPPQLTHKIHKKLTVLQLVAALAVSEEALHLFQRNADKPLFVMLLLLAASLHLVSARLLFSPHHLHLHMSCDRSSVSSLACSPRSR